MQGKTFTQPAQATASTDKCKLDLTEHENYLEARMTAASLDKGQIEDYLRAIRTKLNDVQARHLLIYRDVKNVPSTIDLFTIVIEFLQTIRGTQVALVNPHQELDEQLNFMITVARNRGGNFRLFSDEAAAISWLTGIP